MIDHPFPGYEVKNPTATPIIRRIYFLADQAIATRVSGDPTGDNNGLFYLCSDHLGSPSLLVNSSNNPVAGSRTWYLPFGGYRPGSAPTQTITDRDFTGQKENMELGLLYYNARFYVPGIGRFANADTLVPDHKNPQQFNRFLARIMKGFGFHLYDRYGHDPSQLTGPNLTTALDEYIPIQSRQDPSYEHLETWSESDHVDTIPHTQIRFVFAYISNGFALE